MEGPAASSLSGMGWLFAVAITLHSIEEGIWLPAFSQKKGYWRIPATVTQARVVLVLLTLLAWLCAWLVSRGSVFGTYLLCSYALIMLLNVFIPHLTATIALRQYAPGTATAVLFNLPVVRDCYGWRSLGQSISATETRLELPPRQRPARRLHPWQA